MVGTLTHCHTETSHTTPLGSQLGRLGNSHMGHSVPEGLPGNVSYTHVATEYS